MLTSIGLTGGGLGEISAQTAIDLLAYRLITAILTGSHSGRLNCNLLNFLHEILLVPPLYAVPIIDDTVY